MKKEFTTALRMASFILISLMLTIGTKIHAQELTIPLWQGIPAGSENWKNEESTTINPRNNERIIFNVIKPTLLAFIPDKSIANGTAVIIAPGGAFRLLSYDSEGTFVAEWFKQRGVAAFVLKYRLQNAPPATPGTQQGPQPGNNNPPATAGAQQRPLPGNNNPPATPGAQQRPLPGNNNPPATPGGQRSGVSPDMAAAWLVADDDGRQAMRIVRQRAKEFNISPDKIGFMGFSAGAMLTLHMGLEYDKETRPDFIGLIYAPVRDFKTPPKDAPPMFALSATDDRLTGNSSLLQYQAWRDAGVPTELHVYDKGGHGFGMRKQNLPVDSWIERLGDWLTSIGFMPQK
jgi:acetyl esterase/lipase